MQFYVDFQGLQLGIERAPSAGSLDQRTLYINWATEAVADSFGASSV